MNYITSRELSEKWGISQRRIVRLALTGRIDGAVLYGKSWVFPENAIKPTDGRTRASKSKNNIKTDAFRYPIFEFKNISSFNPPLSKEELTIKAVIEAFDACRFDDANTLLGDLPEKAQNKYIRITALYCGCMLCIFLCSTERFIDLYGKLKAELAGDFPHKAEMSEYIHEIDSTLGEDIYYTENFQNKPACHYHESFLPRLCNLSSLRIAFGDKQIATEDLIPSEIYCGFLENTDNYFDLQAVHIYLACAYAKLNRHAEFNQHFIKALRLAEKYDMFYTFATMQYYYMPRVLEEVMRDFPEEFKANIRKHNDYFRKSHIEFTNKLQINSLYKMLRANDYLYIVFAAQGLTHKEVAEHMNVSVGTVGKRYSEIYNHFGVRDKKELVNLYYSLTDKNTDK